MAKKKNSGLEEYENKVLSLLQERDGLSNAYIRSELDLEDEQVYLSIKESLLKKEWVEKYRCRGGGLRLTGKGESQATKFEEEHKSLISAEKELYAPLVKCLEDSQDLDLRSFAQITAGLKKKGKWQNPDVTQITLETYPRLGKEEIIVTTYEVKQWNCWDITAVFESACHRRFSHEAIVVLEWLSDVTFSLSDATYKVLDLANECRATGVGLYTLEKRGKSYQIYAHIEPIRHVPPYSKLEDWLEYFLTKISAAEKEYEKLFKKTPAKK